MTDVYTMNLSENSDGMVNLNNNKSTNFIAIMNQILYHQLHFLPAQQQQMPNISLEKNLSENKQIMDSTSISDIYGTTRSTTRTTNDGTRSSDDTNANANTNDASTSATTTVHNKSIK